MMLWPDFGFSLALFSPPSFPCHISLSLSMVVGISLPDVGRLLQQNFRGGAGGNAIQQQPPPQQQVRAYPANNYGQFNNY